MSALISVFSRSDVSPEFCPSGPNTLLCTGPNSLLYSGPLLPPTTGSPVRYVARKPDSAECGYFFGPFPVYSELSGDKGVKIVLRAKQFLLIASGGGPGAAAAWSVRWLLLLLVVDEAGGAAEEEKRRLSSCLALHVSQPDREP